MIEASIRCSDMVGNGMTQHYHGLRDGAEPTALEHVNSDLIAYPYMIPAVGSS